LELVSRNLRPKTIEAAEYCSRKIIEQFGEVTPIESVDALRLKQFFADQLQILSPQTVETIFRKTKTWFQFLVEEGLISDNPFKSLKNIKLDRTVLPHLKSSEVEHLLRQLSKPKTIIELRNALLFFTALDTGMRLSELASLQPNDLDLPQIVIRRGKMGRGRIVCVGRTTHKLFNRYVAHLHEIASKPTTLWASASGNSLTDRGIQLVFRRMSSQFGVSVHPHKIRRTTALQYLKSKTDIHTLRQLMGWTSFEMIQRYVAIDATLIEEAVSSSSPVDRMSPVSNRKALNRSI